MPIFFILLFLYILAFFILFRFVIPHAGFKEERVPDEIPASMMGKINEITKQAGSSEEFLKLAFNYLGGRYRSERLNTVKKFNYLFKPLNEVWQMSGYVPCTVSSYLLKIFLIKSGFFKEADIRRRHVFVNFIWHQYLQVKVGGKWINIDVGEKQRGLPLGKHLKWFG